MISIHETKLVKDLANKKILVTREFDAPVEKLWRAWTEPQLLDQWWAPKPWKNNTVSMDFKVGGTWLYFMEGPDGARHYCKADYKVIETGKLYEGLDAFCTEKGEIITDMPRNNWRVEFYATQTGSKVEVILTFDDLNDLHKIIEMGFQEGFAMAHGNLDELLAKQL